MKWWVLLLALAVLASPASAAKPPGPKCQAGKFKQAGAAAARLAKCHASAAAFGSAVLPECASKTQQRLATGFPKLELRAVASCFVSGDVTQVSARLTVFIDAIVSTLRPVPDASSSASSKLATTGKYSKQFIKTHTKDLLKPDASKLAFKLSKLSQKLQSKFAAAERLDDCLSNGDVATVAAHVEDLLADLLRPYSETLSELAAQRGINVGVAVLSDPLQSIAEYASVVETQYSQVVPDVENRWGVIESSPGVVD